MIILIANMTPKITHKTPIYKKPSKCPQNNPKNDPWYGPQNVPNSTPLKQYVSQKTENFMKFYILLQENGLLKEKMLIYWLFQ